MPRLTRPDLPRLARSYRLVPVSFLALPPGPNLPTRSSVFPRQGLRRAPPVVLRKDTAVRPFKRLALPALFAPGLSFGRRLLRGRVLGGRRGSEGRGVCGGGRQVKKTIPLGRLGKASEVAVGTEAKRSLSGLIPISPIQHSTVFLPTILPCSLQRAPGRAAS